MTQPYPAPHYPCPLGEGYEKTPPGPDRRECPIGCPNLWAYVHHTCGGSVSLDCGLTGNPMAHFTAEHTIGLGEGGEVRLGEDPKREMSPVMRRFAEALRPVIDCIQFETAANSLGHVAGVASVLCSRNMREPAKVLAGALRTLAGLIDKELFNTLPVRPLTRCAAGTDGDCCHPDCPQIRDGEPEKSGRSCPLWTDHKDEGDE